MRTYFIVLLVSIALAGIGQDRNGLDTSMQGARANQPRKIIVGAIELHYIEKGKGEPLILLHGGQGDDRSWAQQIKTFAARYRVISYSRRLHYPNTNKLVSADHSALTDAADLAGFLAALNLGPVHLVGHSMVLVRLWPLKSTIPQRCVRWYWLNHRYCSGPTEPQRRETLSRFYEDSSSTSRQIVCGRRLCGCSPDPDQLV